MALLDWAAGLGGGVLVGVALFDVFTTTVVPRIVSRRISATRIIRRLLLPRWRWFAARSGSSSQVLTVFAGLVLVGGFLIWFTTLALGWSLMAWGARQDFAPALPSFWEGLFEVCSSMVTMGLSGHTVHGAARAVMALAGLSGLQVVTLGLTYILQIQTALSQRDPFVAIVSARAGAPPNGLRLLLDHAQLKPMESIGGFFRDAQHWAALIFQTHMAHPVLAYFRSIDDQNDWLLSLGATLDAAALLLALTEPSPETGQAELFRRTAIQTVHTLCGVFGLEEAQTPSLNRADVAAMQAQLVAAGYASAPFDGADRLVELRSHFVGDIQAMAEHFGVRPPVWPPLPADPRERA